MTRSFSQALLCAAAIIIISVSFACEAVVIDPAGPDQKDTTSVIDPPADTTVVNPSADTTTAQAKTASLLYEEASEAVLGYGSPASYTNESGTWTICAYPNRDNMQLNSGKVSYIGTPTFDADITEVRLEFASSYTDKIMLCSESGNKTAVGELVSAKGQGAGITIPLGDVSARKVFIRSSACARISAVYVTYGGQPANPGGSGSGDEDDPEDPGEDDDPDDPGDTPSVTTTGYRWFEVPVVNDADHNGVDDADRNLYYASHSFTNGGRTMRNYTVCYSGEHICPMWVAFPRHSCYEGSASRTDAYTQDPSIPSDIQYKSKATGGGCNKGHMLSSADRKCCTEANRQVFYYTNIAPQYSSGYNTGGGGWNILEDWIDTQVCRDTLYQICGCYFDTYTDGYGCKAEPKTISFGGRSDVDMPTMFYCVLLRTKKGSSGKSVADCSGSELQCAAFVRSHNNSLKGQKPSSREMMSVSDLEKITGFTYFPNVPNAPKSTFSASDWGL